MTDIRYLYRRGKPGQILVWAMEQEENRHRTIHGIQGGNLVTSEWTECVGKQKRTDFEQAAFEVASGYEYQLKRKYFETIAEIDTPRFFAPMLAEKWADTTFEKCVARVVKERVSARSLEGTGVFVEPKLDGFCCIAQATGLTSREGQPIVAVPHIMSALSPFFRDFPDAVLHGELYNHDFKDNFEDLSSILKKQKMTPELIEAAKVMQFWAYDYPSPDVRGLPFSERRELLQMDLGEFTGEGSPIKINPYYPVTDAADVDQRRNQFIAQKYEGAMVKLDLAYRVGKRSWSNLKCKIFDDGEFELVRVEQGLGNYAGFAKSATFRLPDGRTFGAGIKGGRSVFNMSLLENWQDEQKSATVQYFGLTADGIPRMATVKAWLGTEGRVL